jgi:dihydrofolate synthase/folylpolyglutamate synthase
VSEAARLAGRLEALQRRARFGMALGLTAIERAMDALGRPHDRLAVVHVAGSNGKGSTCAMVESIARAAGLRTGLYTSPHLCRFAERIRIDGSPLADEPFSRALGVVMDRADPALTFFETLTAAAFVAFAEARVDLAILEVGLGGRLDATNVVAAPLATAITSIALEHVAVLGPTLDAIAREKAGILKPGRPVVLGPLAPEAEVAARDVAAQVGAAPILRVEVEGAAGDRAPRGAATPLLVRPTPAGLTLSLPPPDCHPVHATLALSGPHQIANAGVAAGLTSCLTPYFPGVRAALARGLAGARWPGRLERLARGSVTVLLDGAHNPEGAEALARALTATGAAPERTLLVFGALADKDWAPMLARLAPLARERYYTQPEGREPVSAAELASVAPGYAAGSPDAAITRALDAARPGDVVVVTGSLYLVGRVRAALLGETCDPVVAL